MRAAMSAYQSGDRIVLVPGFQETAPFPIWTEDVESLTVTGTRVSDTDLGSLAIGLLRFHLLPSSHGSPTGSPRAAGSSR